MRIHKFELQSKTIVNVVIVAFKFKDDIKMNQLLGRAEAQPGNYDASSVLPQDVLFLISFLRASLMSLRKKNYHISKLKEIRYRIMESFFFVIYTILYYTII